MTCSFPLKRSYACDINLCTLHCELRNAEQLLISLGMFAYDCGSLKDCNYALSEYVPDSMKGERQDCSQHQTRAGKCYWEAQRSSNIIFRSIVLYLFEGVNRWPISNELKLFSPGFSVFFFSIIDILFFIFYHTINLNLNQKLWLLIK